MKKILPVIVPSPMSRLFSMSALLFAVRMLYSAACNHHRYDWYSTLRLAVCACCAFAAYDGWKRGAMASVWIMGVVSVIFNPFAPMHLTREAWQPIDVAAMVVCAGQIVTILVSFRKGGPK
jgi:hypothetical protein